MGIVNDYINKLLKIVKKDKNDKDRPWIKLYGDMPDTLNYFNGSMYDYLEESALRNSSRIAYKYYNTEATYKVFMKKIARIANALTQFKIVENECVTLCLPNTPESFALIYAINKIGAIANIVHPLSTTAEIERALKQTNSSVLFCSDASMPKARGIKVKHFIMVPSNAGLVGLLKTLYSIKARKNLKIEDGMMSWEKFLSYKTEKDVYVKRNNEDPAAIIYSGGTTGKPKGIVLSNMNFNAMALQTITVCDKAVPGNTLLSALPIFHVFGLSIGVHSGFIGGMTSIIVPRLNTKRINKELKKYKPSVYPAVPSLLKMSLIDKDPGRNAFKDIKVLVVGGDYLSPELKADMEKYLHAHGSDAIIKIGYGLSEATGFSCSTAPIDEKYAKKGTLGVPNPDTLIKVFEPNSDIEKVPEDIGEICISGPTIMMGYINEEEETNKTLIMHNDGRIWLHTGDLGYMTKDGIFYYSSRLKRMIISNGYNIYPIELEDIISKCKYVDSCTVVAVPHKIKNQTPKAVIVLKEGIEDTFEVRNEIKSYCFKNIARYAVPSEYEFRKSIPKTAVGKVDYRSLQKKEDE